MLQTKKADKDLVAVSCNPTEIWVRRSGKINFNKEEPLVLLDGSKLIINKATAKQFGIEIEFEESRRNTTRAQMYQLKAGDKFWIKGEEYTASTDAARCSDEDYSHLFVVYDTNGEGWFEDDFPAM